MLSSSEVKGLAVNLNLWSLTHALLLLAHAFTKVAELKNKLANGEVATVGKS